MECWRESCRTHHHHRHHRHHHHRHHRHHPILIRIYILKPGWPDLPHSNSNLSNAHSPSGLIQGILLLQTNTLALLLQLFLNSRSLIDECRGVCMWWLLSQGKAGIKFRFNSMIIVLRYILFLFDIYTAKLGANAILGVSLAVCKAGAAQKVISVILLPIIS